MTMVANETALVLDTGDKVALFDIDGTLIDAAYKVTDPSIFEAVEVAQKEGWTIGLSSDTPYDVMKRWLTHFGMNGPIIAEKGAHVVVDESAMPDRATEGHFTRLRDAAIAHFEERAIKVWHGNPVAVLTGEEDLPFDGEPGELVVLVNSYRKHSFGYFVRVFDDFGNIGIDIEHTEQLAHAVRDFYPEREILHEDLNHDHGLMVISAANMNKRVGSLVMKETLGIARFAMIGNSLADFVGKDIAVHLAVGDALPDFKAVANYVAQQPVSSGAAEALYALVEANA